MHIRSIFMLHRRTIRVGCARTSWMWLCALVPRLILRRLCSAEVLEHASLRLWANCTKSWRTRCYFLRVWSAKRKGTTQIRASGTRMEYTAYRTLLRQSYSFGVTPKYTLSLLNWRWTQKEPENTASSNEVTGSSPTIVVNRLNTFRKISKGA